MLRLHSLVYFVYRNLLMSWVISICFFYTSLITCYVDTSHSYPLISTYSLLSFFPILFLLYLCIILFFLLSSYSFSFLTSDFFLLFNPIFPVFVVYKVPADRQRKFCALQGLTTRTEADTCMHCGLYRSPVGIESIQRRTVAIQTKDQLETIPGKAVVAWLQSPHPHLSEKAERNHAKTLIPTEILTGNHPENYR